MPIEKVEFEGAQGNTLAGILDLPDGEPRGFVLFAHCFTCGKSMGVVRHAAKQLNAEGLALLRFDFTGLGQSEGDFAETSFTTNLGDLEAAAAFLARDYQPPAVLVGHSLGGAAVLASAGSIESAKCIAVIGAPAEPVYIKNLISGAPTDEDGTAEVSIGGRPFRIGSDFVDDLERHDLLSEIASLGKPLLIFHSPRDTIVGIENAEKIYTAAKHPKSFISLGDADHLVSRPEDAAFVGHVLSAWAAYYIG